MRNGGRFNLGVYAFKTLRKHRVLWKDPTRGAERPQEPRSSASWGGKLHPSRGRALQRPGAAVPDLTRMQQHIEHTRDSGPSR